MKNNWAMPRQIIGVSHKIKLCRRKTNHDLWVSNKKKKLIAMQIGVFLKIFTIVANVDLNMRFKICKIAI